MIKIPTFFNRADPVIGNLTLLIVPGSSSRIHQCAWLQSIPVIWFTIRPVCVSQWVTAYPLIAYQQNRRVIFVNVFAGQTRLVSQVWALQIIPSSHLSNTSLRLIGDSLNRMARHLGTAIYQTMFLLTVKLHEGFPANVVTSSIVHEHFDGFKMRG